MFGHSTSPITRVRWQSTVHYTIAMSQKFFSIVESHKCVVYISGRINWNLQ